MQFMIVTAWVALVPTLVQAGQAITPDNIAGSPFSVTTTPYCHQARFAILVKANSLQEVRLSDVYLESTEFRTKIDHKRVTEGAVFELWVAKASIHDAAVRFTRPECEIPLVAFHNADYPLSVESKLRSGVISQGTPISVWISITSQVPITLVFPDACPWGYTVRDLEGALQRCEDPPRECSDESTRIELSPNMSTSKSLAIPTDLLAPGEYTVSAGLRCQEDICQWRKYRVRIEPSSAARSN